MLETRFTEEELYLLAETELNQIGYEVSPEQAIKILSQASEEDIQQAISLAAHNLIETTRKAPSKTVVAILAAIVALGGLYYLNTKDYSLYRPVTHAEQVLKQAYVNERPEDVSLLGYSEWRRDNFKIRKISEKGQVYYVWNPKALQKAGAIVVKGNPKADPTTNSFWYVEPTLSF